MIASDKNASIDDALASYFEKLDEGGPVDETSLLARYPQHAAKLQAFFRDQLELNAKVRQLGSGASGGNRLTVRCPNCNQPTDVAVDSSLTDVKCSACGGRFSLIDQSATTTDAPAQMRLGRFHLVERVGMGAFGSVWKAQDDALERTVAIKIPRKGGMTPDEQEKFFREARAAAQLRHPNIVSVHEVGRDGDSIYIVSDFVRGVTLADWLTGQRPTNREAAEMCVKIADALHHAHEYGVVHRDLKPANIMLDGEGQPHLMDFGLARRDVGEVTMTMDGHILGTPAYMSPEQAAGKGHAADRKSDIYSLGVILFQLLTGELPFRGNSRMLMHQVIYDEAPSPRELNARVNRDLNTITLKCLEKSPDKRYRTAQLFADELRRFLRGEPIWARPVSLLEQSARWMLRNKLLSALSATVVMVLMGGVVVSAYFAVRSSRNASLALAREREALEAKRQAESREEESAAVTKFLVDTFTSADPNRKGRSVTVAEVLDGAEKKVEKLPDQPLVQAAIWQAIGDVRPGLGLYKEAVEPARKALEIRERELGPENIETLHSKSAYADALFRLNRRIEGQKIYEEILPVLRKVVGSKNPTTLTAMLKLSYQYRLNGRYDDAIKLASEAYAGRIDLFGPESDQTLDAGSQLGASYRAIGQFDKAVELQQKDVVRQRKKSPPGTPLELSQLASTCYYAGRYQQAIELLLETIKAKEKRLGRDHPDTLNAINLLSASYLKVGRAADAIPLLEEIVATNQKKFGDRDRATINFRMNLGKAYRAVGKTDAAIQDYEAALAAAQKEYGPASRDAVDLTGSLLALYPDDERKQKAIAACEAGLAELRKRYGDQNEIVTKTTKAISKLGEEAKNGAVRRP